MPTAMEIALPTQRGEESGERKASLIDIPASEAGVELLFQGDTLKTTTDLTGSFSFKNLKPGLVRLSIHYKDFEPFSERFELVEGENVIMVTFQRKSETLEAAVVQDEVPVVTMHGDTLVYHAAAIAQMNGDYAVDLLRRFPGIEVKDGQIIVTGKHVKRTYINGALIFGLNPMDSMEYLKANEVVTMNVYDETDPEETLDGVSREKQRVINIKTKNPIVQSMDLQVRALAGLDQEPRDDGSLQPRYGAGANAHFFSEMTQIQTDLVTSNVGMHSSTINMSPSPITANCDNINIILGFNRYWVNPIFGNALQTSYSFGHESSVGRSQRLSEYYETKGIPARLQDTDSHSSGKIRTHELQAYYNYRTGKHVAFSWNHHLRLSYQATSRHTTEKVTISGSDPMLREELSRSDDQAWNLTETLDIRFLAQKPRPTVSFDLNLGRDNLNSWELDTLASSYSKRYLTKDGDGLSQRYGVSVSQMLVNSRKMTEGKMNSIQVQGSYRIGYSSRDRIQEAYDLYSTSVPLVNAVNTFDYTYSSLQNSLNLRLTAHFGTGSMVAAHLSAQAERVLDKERIPSEDPHGKVFYRLVPMLTISGRSVSFSFNSFAITPSVEQLRNRIDDVNPLALIAGNPDLRQSMSYSASLQNNSVRRVSKHLLTWNVNGQVKLHPIVSRTLFYPSETVLADYNGYKVLAGSTLLRSENADYSYDMSGRIQLSSQWGGKWKAASRITPSLSYRSLPQYFGDALDRTTELNPSLGFEGNAYPWKDAMVSFNTNASYIRSRNQSMSMDSRAFRVRAGASVRVDFLKYAFFLGDYSFLLYRNLSSSRMNNDIHRLNLSVGFGLLKDKSLKISIRGVDLLRGGAQYNVSVAPSSIVRAWNPVFGRYFLLDLTYRFNNSGGKVLGLFL